MTVTMWVPAGPKGGCWVEFHGLAPMLRAVLSQPKGRLRAVGHVLLAQRAHQLARLEQHK